MAEMKKDDLIAEVAELKAQLAAEAAEKEAANSRIKELEDSLTTPAAEAAPVAAKETMYKIRRPLIPNAPNPDLYVSINDRDWLIKPGVEVEVPECVYKLLKQKDDADFEIVQRLQSMQEEAENLK